MLVYRIGAKPIELDRSQCFVTDRSRILTGQACPKKREYQYHWNGTGVESAYPSEDLELGSAVHAGLEEMLTCYDKRHLVAGCTDGELVEHCAEIAKKKMIESGEKGMSIQDNDLFGETDPEIAQLLIEEQANLAYALVWTFGRRRLASLLERYEVVAVEPEINWLVGQTDSNDLDTVEHDGYYEHKTYKPIYIVMMSRPDAILRSREDGKLWTVSWKTAQKFDMSYLEELEIHSQTITEGLALEAMYGEPSAGTFFGYFIKGSKKFEPDIGMKRYQSGLIRPYHSYGGIGELGPQHFKFAGEYTNEAGDTKRMTKGWHRTDIWNLMSMSEWLEMLDTGGVQPEAVGRDWLSEQTVEPMLQEFNRAHADRWIKKAIQNEADWMAIVAGERMAGEHEESCFNKWGKKCTFFETCWHGRPIEAELGTGRKRLRSVGNHPAEFGGEDD